MVGVIAAGHPQTAAAGAEILQQGGNAVDAATAAAFASFITEAVLVNIGGGGIAQVFNPKSQQVKTYDFFSSMPGLSANSDNSLAKIDFREILVDFGHAKQPFYIGRGSVAVPGVVAGLCRIVAEMGCLSLSEILAPAIRMAREGVVLAEALEYVASILAPILMDTPKLAAIFAPSGRIASAGERLYFPDLADTLEQLGEQGPSLFYIDEVARKILADQRANGGLLTEADLKAYQVNRADPIAIDYRGYTILLPPPSSSGGVLLAFTLKLLASISVTKLAHNSFEHLRLLIEVMRLTNVARRQWADDCGTASTVISVEQAKCIDEFLADKNIRRYSQQLSDTLAGRDVVPDPELAKGPSNTTHISVADSNGMVVSITTSAGENAGYVVDDTGVMLNNMLGEIDLHPDGFHRLAPGQRLMTMMSPVIVLRQGNPVLAVGSGGSNRLRTAILQVISNFIDFKLNLDEAVDAPRVHFEDNVIQLEGGIASGMANQLEEAGYTVNRWPERNMFFGGTHAVAQEKSSKQSPHWVAAGDRRRGGSILIV